MYRAFKQTFTLLCFDSKKSFLPPSLYLLSLLVNVRILQQTPNIIQIIISTITKTNILLTSNSYCDSTWVFQVMWMLLLVLWGSRLLRCSVIYLSIHRNYTVSNLEGLCNTNLSTLNKFVQEMPAIAIFIDIAWCSIRGKKVGFGLSRENERLNTKTSIIISNVTS